MRLDAHKFIHSCGVKYQLNMINENIEVRVPCLYQYQTFQMTSTFGSSLEDIQAIPEDGECILSTICQKTSSKQANIKTSDQRQLGSHFLAFPVLPAEVLLLEAARENNLPQISVLVKQRNVGVNVSDNVSAEFNFRID